jgi:hypothetical protein
VFVLSPDPSALARAGFSFVKFKHIVAMGAKKKFHG